MFLSLRFPTFRGRETLGMSDAGMGSWLGAFVFGGSMFGVVLFGCLIFVGVGGGNEGELLSFVELHVA